LTPRCQGTSGARPSALAASRREDAGKKRSAAIVLEEAGRGRSLSGKKRGGRSSGKKRGGRSSSGKKRSGRSLSGKKRRGRSSSRKKRGFV
jgi:hypothetical protein